MGLKKTIFSDRAGRFLIRASSPDFFGVRCGVQFERGIGRTDEWGKASDLLKMGFDVSGETGVAGSGCDAGGAKGGGDESK